MTHRQPYILGHFILAGLSHREPGTVSWRTLGTETPIRLIRERYNPHDVEAIAVGLETGTLLGYIRREDNRVPAAFLDQGAPLAAKIAYARLDGEGNPLELRVEIALDLHSQEATA